MECVCSQPSSLGAMSGARRYFVFLVAMAETMLWSGTIFGWASLVHVLKVQGVYSNLCPDHAHTPAHNTTTHTPLSHNKTGVVCGAQDDRMALLYTVACVVYSTPGIFIGYSLHHFGLAFTRVMGGLMVSCGFILLSLTTAATPDYLWGATILLSVGGNTIRMSGLQFGNLFPEGRNTAMAIISGVFTPSAGIMTLLQTMYENGMDWSYICWVFAAASSLVVVATPFIPRHHIPVSMQPGESRREQNTWYIVCCQRHVFFILSIPSVISYVSQPARSKLGNLEGLRKLMRPPMVTYGSIVKG